MVSPGTHLIKNHETMSITNELLLKTTRGHKLKVLEPSCNQTVNLETDDKTLYCRLLKLKYRLKQIQSTVHTLTRLNLCTQRPLSSVPKAKVADMERFNFTHASSHNSHKNHTINGSLHPMGHMNYFGGTQRTINQLIFW